MKSSRFHLSRWLIIAFTLVCAVVYSTIFVLNTKNQEIVTNERWVKHTYDVLDTTDIFFSNLQDMHIAQRGYLLTGDEAFLGPYKTGHAVMWEKFKELETLTRDNPERGRDLAQLKVVLDKQDALLKKQIRERLTKNSYQLRDMQASKSYMDRIRTIKKDMYANERVLLLQRRDHENRTTQNYIRTIFILAGLSIMALLVANGLIGALVLRRAKAEDNLRRTNKEMESFTYIASHDLRSPLVNLRGFASEMTYSFDAIKPIIEKNLASMAEADRKTVTTAIEKEIPQALTFIHASVEKMNRLTNGILELSRIGKRDLKNEWIDVRSVVMNTLKVFHHQIAERGIAVDVSVIMPHIKADPFSLEQIFSNIIDNAIKYLDPERPGTIEIGGMKDRDKATFWVKDNGRGIREQDMDKIFEIYRRAGDTTHIPGEGLGMAYVRSTLRRLGGQIWCESTLGTGTVFYFTISNKWQKEALHD